MNIRICGGLEVTNGHGQTIDLGPPQCRALFATLALTPNQPVAVTRLITCLWGEEPPRTVDKTLQSYVSVLRRSLTPHDVSIERVGAAYVLRLDPSAVDVVRFEQALTAGDVATALGEWTGTPLLGLDLPALDPVVARLTERWQGAVETHLADLIDGGRSQDAIGRLTELAAEMPYRERLWELLMTALYKVDRQADALAAYGEARRNLVDGLGVEPGRRLRELEAAILRQDPALTDNRPVLDRRVTMAFLFTDIEGSTYRWEAFPEAMRGVLERHDALLDTAVAGHHGTVFSRTGDGIIACFPRSDAAVHAATAVQHAMASTDWDEVGGLRVRSAVHVGEVVLRDGEPFGWALNFGSRLNSLGHGGQILVSETAVDQLHGALGDGLDLMSLGTRRLRDIARPTEVFQLTGPTLLREFPSLRTGDLPKRLVHPPRSLVGRAEETAQVASDLRAHRLVSLVGPPGVGTSRLAIAAADLSSGAFEDGIVRVDLGGIDPDDLASTIATALGVASRHGQSTAQTLVEWLGDQRMLLILEHGERAVDAVAPLVSSILGRGEHPRILWAGHRTLGVPAERVHRVGPLALDDAVELFVGRAAAAGSTVEDSPELRALCTQLDRIPLAIEAAAANTAVHSVAELAELFGRHRLADVGDADEGLRPMLEAIAVTIDALPSQLASMLAAATTFAGPFDLATFAEVCAPGEPAADAALTELVNRSLVQVQSAEAKPLFAVLDIVAGVARRRVDPEVLLAASSRFVASCLDFVRAAAAGLRGPGEARWVIGLNRHLPNIRAAFERSLAAGDVAAAATFSTELWDYGFMRFDPEYFRWSQRLIDTVPDGDEALLGPVHGVAALGAWIRDDVDAAFAHARCALELERERSLDFDLPARLALMNATVYSGAKHAPPEIFAEQAAFQLARPELYFHVNVSTQQTVMATWMGDSDGAIRRGVKTVRLARESQNPSALSFALWGLGSALESVDPVQAETLLGNALELARSVDNSWLTAIVEMSLASLRRRTSSAIEAAPLLVNLLELLWRGGHQSHVWATLRLCGLVLGDLGNDAVAAQLRSLVIAADLAMPPLPVDAAALDEQHAARIELHGQAWADRMDLLAQTMTVESTVALARTELARSLGL